MSIALGNIPLNKIYLGSTEIKKVYKGNILMWEGDQFTYYVTNDGNDSNDGLTPQTAWATISKVNSVTLTAGQSVGFRRGDVWREELVIGESGSIGNPITFGAYGVGALPVISGADVVNGFVENNTGEPGPELITNGTFDTDVTGWVGNGGDSLLHESGTIGGRSNLAKYTSNSTSFRAMGQTGRTWTLVPHVLTFDVYIPSSNATANTIRARQNFPFTDISGGSQTIPLDTWTTVSITFTPIAQPGGIYLYLTNGVSTYNVSVDDVAYFDNVSVKLQATPLSNMWDATVTTQPNIVLLNGERGIYRTSKAACVNSGDWYWSGDVLSVKSSSDPSGLVEAGKRNQCVSGTGNYITFDRLKFTGNQTFSIYYTGSNKTITNCTFEKIGGRGQNGIGFLISGSDHTVQKNLFIDIERQGIATDGTASTGVVISENHFDRCWNKNNYLAGGDGYGINAGGDGWVIKRNSFVNCYLGITLDFARNCLVHHNLLVTCKTNGIAQNSNGVLGSPNSVYNNTIIHNPNTNAGHAIVSQSGTNAYINIKNNLVYLIFIGTNVNVDGITIQESNYVGVDIDYNLVYKIPESTAALHKMDDIQYFTMASWQTAVSSTSFAGKGVNHIEDDPLFVNFAAGNYRLQSGSPAINAGVDVGLTEDFDGNPIVGVPCIGAFEYQP